MKPLSPVDAIAPAFSRVRTLLLPPADPGQPRRFRFGFFFKMVLVAALTNAGFYGGSLGFSMQGAGAALRGTAEVPFHRHAHYLLATSGPAAALLTALVLGGVIALALSVIFGWLWCRLRFTFFDLVVYCRGQVAVAWSRYGAQAWRYFGLMVLLGLALLLILASTAGPLFVHLFAVLRHMTPQQINTNPVVIFEHILPLYGVLALFGVVATIVDAVTQDFLLPPMALEDAPLESAFSRFFGLVRTRFWSVAAYLLLRFVMELGLTWAGLVAVFLVLLVLTIGGGVAGFVLYRALWHVGGAAAVIFILYCVVAGLILFAFFLLAMICIYGIVALFKQCYAVYFYGSYYQELGSRLDPPEPNLAPLPEPPAPAGLPPALGSPPPIW